MAGTLFVVATPIGNLSDLSPRAADTLRDCHFIAAEDTRVTVKLLNHLGLKKPMVSYHAHNERGKVEAVLDRIEAGEDCALCSDAGTPAISDPGQLLVEEAHRRGIQVVPLPGPSAAIAALCASGQDTSRFVFEGFLSVNKGQRAKRLADLSGEQRTILLYEAPHKLTRTLADLAAAFGAERQLTLCRELTKLHEEIYRTTLGEAQERYRAEAPRGEFVLVLAGCDTPEEEAISLEETARLALRLTQAEGLPMAEAARRLAGEGPYAKNAIYKEMLGLHHGE